MPLATAMGATYTTQNSDDERPSEVLPEGVLWEMGSNRIESNTIHTTCITVAILGYTKALIICRYTRVFSAVHI